MYNPYQPINQNFSTFQQKQEVIRVSGENGAKAYPLAPNSSVLLLDETAPIIWLKTTDGASYPTITGYNIIPIEESKEIEANVYSDLEKRIERLEQAINDKSNTRNDKQQKQSTTK